LALRFKLSVNNRGEYFFFGNETISNAYREQQ